MFDSMPPLKRAIISLSRQGSYQTCYYFPLLYRALGLIYVFCLVLHLAWYILIWSQEGAFLLCKPVNLFHLQMVTLKWSALKVNTASFPLPATKWKGAPKMVNGITSRGDIYLLS